MSRKKQEIHIHVHGEEQMKRIYNRKKVVSFWEMKIGELLRKSGIDKKDLQ